MGCSEFLMAKKWRRDSYVSADGAYANSRAALRRSWLSGASACRALVLVDLEVDVNLGAIVKLANRAGIALVALILGVDLIIHI